jgi:hypothetical protein
MMKPPCLVVLRAARHPCWTSFFFSTACVCLPYFFSEQSVFLSLGGGTSLVLFSPMIFISGNASADLNIFRFFVFLHHISSHGGHQANRLKKRAKSILAFG